MKQILLAGLLSLGLVSSAQAGFMVTIQPSSDLNDIVWTVSWDSAPADSFPLTWDAMDPATGSTIATAPWGSDNKWTILDNVGDPFGPAYANAGNAVGFGDGVGGVVSSPGGWGVGPDHDVESAGDDFIMFNTQLNNADPWPSTGSFVLTVPGANLSNYNIGTYTNNSEITIVVTDTPFSAVVPEPSTFALLGIGGIALVGYGWRRKRQQAA